MMRFAYPLAIDNFFAHAGQAVVERAVLAALISQGHSFRLLAHGTDLDQIRLSAYCHEWMIRGLVDIMTIPGVDAAVALEGMDALLLHSLPLQGCWDWVTTHQIVARLPTIQYVHSLLLANFELHHWSDLWLPWQQWPPAYIVAPSQSTAHRVESIARTARTKGGVLPPVKVIAHGTDLPEGSRRRGRQILGLAENTLVILSLGRISHEKADYRQLLFCYYHLLKQGAIRQPTKLVIGGSVAHVDKGYYYHLHLLVERLRLNDQVIFIENVEEEDKHHILFAADIFVSLANNPQESFGIALLEALSAGLPVVATDWDGYREVLPRRFHEFMVPTVGSHRVARETNWRTVSEACAPSYRALERHLRRLAGDQVLRAQLKKVAQDHATRFSWLQAGTQLVNLFRELKDTFHCQAAPFSKTSPHPWTPRSMIDALASSYLSDDTLLSLSITYRLPGSPSPTDLISFRLPEPTLFSDPPSKGIGWLDLLKQRHRLLYSDERTNYLWSTRNDKVLLRELLAHCHQAGPDPISVGQLRHVFNWPVVQFDWIVLQLIRYGILEIVAD